MEHGFQDELASWGPFFGFVGGAAATLLGLLFVAVSLRLNIFRDEATADVRDFARLTLFSFLTPMAIAGLVLMPHEQPVVLALSLFAVAIIGAAATIYIVREWLRLNPRQGQPAPGLTPAQWQGWVYVVLVASGYVALAVVGMLFLWGSDLAFVGLAVAAGWMLLTGTTNAWIMLSNAGGASDT